MYASKFCLAALISTSLGAMPAAAMAIDLTSLPGITVSTPTPYYFSSSNGPKDNILDNNFDTYWNGGAYADYVQVDFGAAYVFDRIELYGNPGYVNNFQVLASLDGTSWGAIASGSYHNESALSGSRKFGAAFDFAAAGAPVGRYLRYAQGSGPQWAYLGELEVTGHLPVAAAPAVPEPDTWALLLAGLGLIGVAARRK
ncbi:MAG TPA: discoidin domain-containing protein [Methyloversatilis sp.]